MKREDVIAEIEKTFATCNSVFATKGQEYANDDSDQLANFKRIANNLGVDPYVPLMTYMTKHWDSINNFVNCAVNKKEYTSSEPIEGRVDDLILYGILLKCLITENKNDYQI